MPPRGTPHYSSSDLSSSFDKHRNPCRIDRTECAATVRGTQLRSGYLRLLLTTGSCGKKESLLFWFPAVRSTEPTSPEKRTPGFFYSAPYLTDCAIAAQPTRPPGLRDSHPCECSSVKQTTDGLFPRWESMGAGEGKPFVVEGRATHFRGGMIFWIPPLGKGPAFKPLW